jgi:hypothetical protein
MGYLGVHRGTFLGGGKHPLGGVHSLLVLIVIYVFLNTKTLTIIEFHFLVIGDVPCVVAELLGFGWALAPPPL